MEPSFGKMDGADLRRVIDALPRGVVVADRQGRVVLWNTTAERMYGWFESEVLGRSLFEIFTSPEPLADRERHWSDRVAAGSTTIDRMVTGRDGQPLLAVTFTQPVTDHRGEVVFVVGAAEDVTATRSAEQQARELTAHLQLALEAGGLGTWRWDMRAGTITWDERLEAIFGIAPGSFDGSFDTYVGMLHPDDREGVLAEVRRAVEGKSSYRVEHRVVWPDGSTHWISGAGTVTRDNEGEVTGTVGCTLDVTDRVSGEIERRQLVAAAVAAADNERLQRERLEVVSSINDGLNQSDSVRSAMVNATSRSVPRLGDWCSIHVLAESGSQIPLVHLAHADPQVLQRGRELLTHFPYDPHSRSGVANVIRTGDTVFYPEISDEVAHDIDASAQARHIISGLALRSVIIVPLVKRGKILGAMQFAMTTAGRQYTFDDVALAEAVAGRVASSIQNHRLNDQQREIATTLQRSLLPHRLPEIDGVDVAVRYWPAGERTEVGGDFYDVFGVDDQGHNFAVVIGDVCGTGPGAAALTGLARHSIRASAWHGDHPVDVLASLDRAVKRSGADTFLTALYSEIRRSGDGLELTIAAGGHPLPVLVNAQGAQTIGHPGSLLGAVDSPAWSATSVRLGPDDVVVFYTDGATDLRRPHGLSATQFADLARDAVGRHDTAEAIADTIHQRLEAIVSFEHRDDDIALLILRVASAPSSLEDGEGKGDRARSHDRDGGPTQHRGQSVVAVRAHDHPIGRHQ